MIAPAASWKPSQLVNSMLVAYCVELLDPRVVAVEDRAGRHAARILIPGEVADTLSFSLESYAVTVT